jgi:malate dehydrogenase (oxaloacetate-decarboxylating)(NADP+)
MSNQPTSFNNNSDESNKHEHLKKAALDFHEFPTRGKLAIQATKPLANQRDLSLAYSPGVAFPCLEIAEDESASYKYTSRGNLVAVISNGTAVLGLGDIGAAASKPVMEGKACLFKKFAGIDVFDIEINEKDPAKLIEIIASLEPTLGGINLEDIKAPECFQIEKELSKRMNIPIFHDDQHGTAVISNAAILNALKIVGKNLSDVKIAVSGAGAAAIACLDLMVDLGANIKNIFVCDSKGLIHSERSNLDASKQRYAQTTNARTLADAMVGADIFLGCSVAGAVTPDMLKTMADKPIVLAMANPEPEIRPELAKAARPDCIIATGRSDYPNQVNNVLCFPYIFRGALDCGASEITQSMKLACVKAIAELTEAEINDAVAKAYLGEDLRFGPEYIIPKPFDPRLILKIAPAVARAAAESGVARRPIADLAAYEQELQKWVYHTGMMMRPVFTKAKQQPKTIIYVEGEDERILRAVQTILDEGIAKPILLGDVTKIQEACHKAGLRYMPSSEENAQVRVINPHNPCPAMVEAYRKKMERQGITPALALSNLQKSATLFASLMIEGGWADGMICGVVGRYDHHLAQIKQIIPQTAPILATVNALMLENHNLLIADTYINDNPDAKEIAQIAKMAAKQAALFGLEPKVALLSHSMFGGSSRASATKMAEAYRILEAEGVDFAFEGEIKADAALDEEHRHNTVAEFGFSGSANVLVMPNLDAANIGFNLLKVIGGQNVTIGPILMGLAKPVHVLTPAATTRRIINMSAYISAQV